MRSKLTIKLAVPVAAMTLAACSPPAGPDGQQGTAIQSHPGIRLPGIVPTGRIIDFAGLVENHDDAPFRIRSVRVISPSGPGIGQITIRALAPSSQTGGTFAFFQGNLARCPKRLDYRVLPVTRITEPPNGTSDWRLLVSIVFAKPGRYHLYQLRVNYTEGGRHYWNYLRADIPVRAVSPKTDPSLILAPC